MARYSDVHRIFLQSLISRRFLSENLAIQLYKRSCEIVAAAEGTDPSTQPFQNALELVANALSPIGLEIRALVDEGTKQKMIAIVNTKGDAIAQVATEFTPNEIAYFKLIVECIMLAPSESFSLSSIAAIKESTNLPSKMTKTEAESTLNAFVSKGWLLRSKRGRYSLSTRSILELQNYLKSTFEDEVLECTICMEICTKGIACSIARCKTRMHTHCYENYKMLHRHCPTCSSPWDGKRPIPVGEEAVKDGPDSRRSKKRVEPEVVQEEEEEEEDVEDAHEQEFEEEASDEEMEEEEERAPPPNKGRQRKAKHMDIATRFVDDEAEDD
ncbi:hypothetical protein DACRYDRAFT_92739 [Dacryopinax primogenitus]|uniref:Non-structural maintenance of chromosomes element 1 homolog n=1 Tax=Dacryopinax primogenitus (strain DJM 731) TaxID=1858805 RepID=M5GAM1_DACPD|nr:uncharacterized protein DACRYDRAFT_92739 [Dacryopinax primogenitus]EJU05410.1 hypothetical protein DACRYDRAFT_92739 [Dacryopinax primogenitus]